MIDYKERLNTMKKLNVAVIGVGYFGEFHLKKYLSMIHVNVVGIVEPDNFRRSIISEYYDVKAFSTVKALMKVKSLDAVSIASPTNTHFHIAKECLENFLDVFIEKPMTTTAKEAWELNQIASSHNKFIQIGFVERFNHNFTKNFPYKVPNEMKFVRTTTEDLRCCETNIILDLMIHDIDIALSLANSSIQIGNATGHTDFAHAKLQFTNTCYVDLIASRKAISNVRKITLYYEDETIEIDMLKDKNDALRLELLEFVDCCLQNKKPQATGWEGYRALLIAENLTKCIEGKRINIAD
jgi:predicted dehydrogenase